MKSAKFDCLVSMTEHILKTMNLMDQLLVIRVNKRNSYLKELFCQAYCFKFFSSQNRFFVKHIVLLLSL